MLLGHGQSTNGHPLGRAEAETEAGWNCSGPSAEERRLEHGIARLSTARLLVLLGFSSVLHEEGAPL